MLNLGFFIRWRKFTFSIAKIDLNRFIYQFACEMFHTGPDVIMHLKRCFFLFFHIFIHNRTLCVETFHHIRTDSIFHHIRLVGMWAKSTGIASLSAGCASNSYLLHFYLVFRYTECFKNVYY